MARFDLRQLELFVAAMECSSLTKASEKMHLTPGAVSLQLRDLALQLHTDLFVKSGRQLVPTPDAFRLLKKVEPLMRQVREIEQEFESEASGDSRPIHFACGATTLSHSLGEPLRRLRSQFPNASIQITVGTTEDMVAGLLVRKFDLAIITLPFPTGNLRIIPLFDEELLIVRPAASVRTWQVGFLSPSELESVPFLLHSERSNMRAIVDRFFSGIGVKPNVTAEADDVAVLRRLVESGFGYSILPYMGLQQPPQYFDAFRVPGHRILRTQALALARSERQRPLTGLIAKFLQTALSENAPACELLPVQKTAS